MASQPATCLPEPNSAAPDRLTLIRVETLARPQPPAELRRRRRRQLQPPRLDRAGPNHDRRPRADRIGWALPSGRIGSAGGRRQRPVRGFAGPSKQLAPHLQVGPFRSTCRWPGPEVVAGGPVNLSGDGAGARVQLGELIQTAGALR